MPLVQTNLKAVYSEDDIKRLIVEDLKKYGQTVKPDDIQPTDLDRAQPADCRTIIIDSYTVNTITAVTSPPMKREHDGRGPG